MAQHNLESLLFLIRDGKASGEDLARARALVQSDERLPDELREVIDFEDAEGDAVGLLAVLGADSLFGDVLREGIALDLDVAPMNNEDVVTADQVDGPWELNADFVAAVGHYAGSVELASSVLDALNLHTEELPLAEAIRSFAGEVEVAAAVLAQLGLPAFEMPLAAAIAGEAGGVDLLSRIESELTDLGLPLAEAIRFEAGTVELADEVLATVGGTERVPVAEAVRSEAGSVELWAGIEPIVSGAWVSAMLDRELDVASHKVLVKRLHDDPEARESMTTFASMGSDIRSAVQEGAGPCPYIWAEVAKQVGVEAELVEGWDGEQFAAALRSEAGTVDVAAAVMQRVSGAARMPSSVGSLDEVPAPANRGFSLGTVLMMAAAALLILGVPQMYRGAIVDGSDATEQMVGSNDRFASAGEIIVEELDYGENSNVYQATGDQGALILWVDEGKTL